MGIPLADLGILADDLDHGRCDQALLLGPFRKNNLRALDDQRVHLVVAPGRCDQALLLGPFRKNNLRALDDQRVHLVVAPVGVQRAFQLRPDVACPEVLGDDLVEERKHDQRLVGVQAGVADKAIQRFHERVPELALPVTLPRHRDHAHAIPVSLRPPPVSPRISPPRAVPRRPEASRGARTPSATSSAPAGTHATAAPTAHGEDNDLGDGGDGGDGIADRGIPNEA
eukprot:CAMPEP_0198246560 /NCGR_PEP_ID=MMETSP1446-20131203/46037_1 /TAXON_ID=1461542 ORGANISM="Unidentified sp, Strain CCMP2111" /NCGR_SAMPLE_ID=MMETSP1446 /ASSEMBLY_ACC=CAM_ASM_001112 /LENGTH=226 /DNA_ID=CAMNT_0043930881 /DNA_START=230 /DNA_END=910 /DNA_ORIENTATION=-